MSIFDLTLGVGVTTGGGRVRDDSLTVTVPGRGLGATVGRKIGVNAPVDQTSLLENINLCCLEWSLKIFHTGFEE